MNLGLHLKTWTRDVTAELMDAARALVTAKGSTNVTKLACVARDASSGYARSCEHEVTGDVASATQLLRSLRFGDDFAIEFNVSLEVNPSLRSGAVQSCRHASFNDQSANGKRTMRGGRFCADSTTGYTASKIAACESWERPSGFTYSYDMCPTTAVKGLLSSCDGQRCDGGGGFLLSAHLDTTSSAGDHTLRLLTAGAPAWRDGPKILAHHFTTQVTLRYDAAADTLRLHTRAFALAQQPNGKAAVLRASTDSPQSMTWSEARVGARSSEPLLAAIQGYRGANELLHGAVMSNITVRVDERRRALGPTRALSAAEIATARCTRLAGEGTVSQQGSTVTVSKSTGGVVAWVCDIRTDTPFVALEGSLRVAGAKQPLNHGAAAWAAGTPKRGYFAMGTPDHISAAKPTVVSSGDGASHRVTFPAPGAAAPASSTVRIGFSQPSTSSSFYLKDVAVTLTLQRLALDVTRAWSAQPGAAESPSLAFDGDRATEWGERASNYQGTWLLYSFPQPQVLSHYSFLTANALGGRRPSGSCPYTWELQGSNDAKADGWMGASDADAAGSTKLFGSTIQWTRVATGKNANGPCHANKYVTYSVPSTAHAYKHYRWRFSKGAHHSRARLGTRHMRGRGSHVLLSSQRRVMVAPRTCTMYGDTNRSADSQFMHPSTCTYYVKDTVQTYKCDEAIDGNIKSKSSRAGKVQKLLLSLPRTMTCTGIKIWKDAKAGAEEVHTFGLEARRCDDKASADPTKLGEFSPGKATGSFTYSFPATSSQCWSMSTSNNGGSSTATWDIQLNCHELRTATKGEFDSSSKSEPAWAVRACTHR